ncbi:hypothetical protein [Microvirga guangxiensis]|uniref:HdeA/HdeB family protein n=1 Tax=Microvirga guangxiensis TaxID=549386 RepID=A0A1G5EQR7_9HYPH|nr:hypothetical protein [Microvirga guangxiensis]SCY29332.1 hypothetical protein SAMN02927923_01075 [Microvirga guangxiensis]
MKRSAIMVAALAMAGSCAAGLSCAVAQEPSWVEVKCDRYKKAWDDALARRGTKGLGQEFLDRHEAFLVSGCVAKAEVCPRSEEELTLANMMVVAAMNAGTASTFPPFACRK